MQNIYRLSIILSFFGLWLVSIMSINWQTYVGFFFIFTFGIIHGTNDLVLISKIDGNAEVNYFKVLKTYLLVILTTVILFKWIPFGTLILFICFSSYHFGEQHFEYLQQSIYKKALYSFQFLYGLFILTILFYCNSIEVIKIIYEMTNVQIEKLTFFYGQIIVGVLLILNGIYIGIHSSQFKSKIFEEIFYLLIFVILFNSTTLIWGFALYLLKSKEII